MHVMRPRWTVVPIALVCVACVTVWRHHWMQTSSVHSHVSDDPAHSQVAMRANVHGQHQPQQAPRHHLPSYVHAQDHATDQSSTQHTALHDDSIPLSVANTSHGCPPWPEREAASRATKTLRVVAVGDVSFARDIRTEARMHFGARYTWVFDKVRNQLQDADLTIVNLESPLLPSGATVQGKPGRILLHGDAAGVTALKDAGVDVVREHAAYSPRSRWSVCCLE